MPSSSRLVALLLPLALAACATDDPAQEAAPGVREAPARLAEGVWSGGLTPMNHPDMFTPVTYRLDYVGSTITLGVTAPDGTYIPAGDVALDGDTLRFVFVEPDAGVPLRCALGRAGDDFAGRCTDPEGKWARFTMTPPGERG